MKSPFNFFSNSSDEERTQELKGLSLFKELSGRELRELSHELFPGESVPPRANVCKLPSARVSFVRKASASYS